MSESDEERFGQLLESLARMAGGDLDHRIGISSRHDHVDAVAHAINVLVGELQLITADLRRAKEEAESANLAKTTFLRNVSHELRTPLTVILGMSDLIASQRVPKARVPELQRRIAANGRALVGILDDLLDLAKVEAQKLDVQPQPLHLIDAVADVVASFEPMALRKGIEVTLEAPDTAPRVLADPKRLRQVLTNIIGNAVKFTSEGRVVARPGESEDGQRIFVDISDTGIGLSPEQRRVLFEPFAQADETIAGRFGGSGLGLALSKRLAEAMGGDLDVLESQPGVGTTFRIELPAAPADAPHIARAPGPATRSATELLGQRILVADDNEEVRSVTAGLLRLAGAEVVEAADGREALERYGEQPFDAILMDVRMPEIDGLEATRRLRAEGAELTIVAMTADALAEQKTACLDAGCSAYMTKPLDFDRLVAILTEERAPRPSR